MTGQGYNFGGEKAALLRKRLGQYRRMNESRRWNEDRLLELSDLVADGHDWVTCGLAMDCSPEECERQFAKTRARYGEQGR